MAPRKPPQRKTGKAAPEKPSFRISDSLVARSKGKPVKTATSDQPFTPSAQLHPPGVIPRGGRRLAQDEGVSASSAWANSVIISAFAEGLVFMGYAELALLAQRPEYRRMVETIARHMTRKWIEFKSTGDDDKADKIKKIEDAMKRLNVQSVFQKAAEQDGYFGRGHIYLDTGATDDPAELKTPIGDGRNSASRSKTKKGALKALRTVEAVWCYPTQYNSSDPLSADWYKPKSWFVLGKELDKSRILTFISREVPDLLKPAYSFGGLSLTQIAKPYVDNWLRTRQSVADIISAFSVFVLSTNLTEQLNTDSTGDQLFKRAEFFNNMRDNRGLMMIDKNLEEFQNVSASLATLDSLQAQTQEHQCAVSGIPLIELLGIQPAGLNVTSKDEIQVFDDTIHAAQELLFREPLGTVINFIQLSEFGEVDPEITFDFCPLRSLDDAEQAEVQKTKADTDLQYVDIGAIDASEVRQRLTDDPDSPYQGLDPNKVPKPPEPPTPSAEELLGGPKPPGAADATFRESDHPRDRIGQFGTGSGGGGSPSKGSGVKAKGLKAADALKGEWQKGSPKTVDDLVSASSANQSTLAAAAGALEATTGAKFVNPGVKTRARIEQKMARGRSAESITDAVRGGFNVTSPEQADKIIDGLAEHFEVADEGWFVTESGYFDRKVMVHFDDGQVGEVQIWPPGMLETKHSEGHQLYQEWQAAEAGGKERRQLQDRMIALYSSVRFKLPGSWGQVLGGSGS